MLACFGFGKSQKNYPFTSFLVKVDQRVVWESTMAKILKKTKYGLRDFKMHDDGILQVSGELDPGKLLKVLAKTDKTALLIDIKCGGCPRNLNMEEFERRQGYKADLKHYFEMHGLYNDFYQRYMGGYAQGNYGYYGNGYVGNYGNHQYLHG